MGTPQISLVDAIILELVFDVLDLGLAVRRWQAVFTQIDEDNLLHREDAFAGDLVTHFALEGD
jgi:hypothetical protein